MKRMNKKFIAGTAFAVTAAAALAACAPQPTVYGPPPAELEETTDETVAAETATDETAAETQINDFDPENEVNEDVYGPPEFFE